MKNINILNNLNSGKTSSYFTTNGTYVSGTKQGFTGTQENFLIELNISAYTIPSNTFRIMFTLAPSNSFMQISKIYLSKYKLT